MDVQNKNENKILKNKTEQNKQNIYKTMVTFKQAQKQPESQDRKHSK